jgi:hypothetical protein
MADDAAGPRSARSRWDVNLEGYRMVAELLTSVRRIVGRAVERVGPDPDTSAPWPDEVRKVLTERHDAERDVPRPGGSDDLSDDLLAFATFGDLAARVRASDELAALVDKLGAGPGDLLERLDALEVIRDVVAEARLLSADEIEALRSHHQAVGEMLSGGRRRPSAEADSSSPPETTAAPTRDGDDVDELVEEVEEALPIDDDLGVDFAAVDESRVRAAIESEQDSRVLAMLHAEIMALAEDVFAGRRGRPRPAWHAICDSGWYASRRESRGLDVLEAFHATIDAWDEAADVGAQADQLREILRGRGFSGLLLSLRDMFDRNRF